jgi:hypothetical protein
MVIRYFPILFVYVAIVLFNDIFNTLFSKSLMTISAEIFNEETYVSFKSILSALNQSVYVFGQAVMGFILMSARISLFAVRRSFICAFLIIYFNAGLSAYGQKTVLNGKNP